MKRYDNVAGGYITPQEKSDTIEYTYYKNNIRQYAPSYTQFYDKPQKNIKRCKICVDRYDNGKILTMMARQHKAIKEQVIEYYIDVKNGVVRKLKEQVRYCANHHIKLVLNSSNYYKGTKSMALKKLKSEIKKAQ